MRIPLLNDTERLGFALRLGDLALLGLAGLGALHWQADGGAAPVQLTSLYVGGALSLALFPRFGMYQLDAPEAPPTLTLRLAAALLTVMAGAMLFAALLHPTARLSGMWLAHWLMLALPALLAPHLAARNLNWASTRVLVIGKGDVSHELYRRNRLCKRRPYRIDAFCITDGAAGPQATGIDCIADTALIPDYVGRHGIDQIWIALPLRDAGDIARLQHLLRNTMVDIRWLQDVRDLQILNINCRTLYDFPVMDLNCMKPSAASHIEKYIFDKCFSLAALVVFAPLMLLIVAAIKLDSRGPVLFVQPRIGLNGRQFKVFKFRSMHRHEPGATLQQAARQDARVTRVGRFLRRTSLDELPQFINVLLGDMSVVGPRPHAVSHTEMYSRQLDVYMVRHRAKPGITGWAQINGARGETDTLDKMIRRVQFDLYYLQHWSLWMDIRIVLWTACKGWTGNNVY
ncbi:undecaprenyl-phosphate glucose phosphotransferase [Duganella aceris]|uniref:Undecaprenyl-phosphate glucose phosphotransferase n=1 Tax=Duganella aceris TaxID=2703883 RepID=A0ABX0FJS0_9BURK|nr:undecaprenyl-phosphate glucose phosphotransferase [Duganella aceris]NGZ84766.1 undecaprenyl-phosphate glucose phosphotransferase [Duganella aceris]